MRVTRISDSNGIGPNIGVSGQTVATSTVRSGYVLVRWESTSILQCWVPADDVR